MADRRKLTAGYIETLPTTGKRYRVHDTAVPGLSVTVMASGSKRWQYRYSAGGRQHTLSIGDAEAIRPHKAREIAKKAAGQDLHAQKMAARAAAKAATEERRQASARTLEAFIRTVYEPEVLRHRRSGRLTEKRIRHVWAPLLDRDLGAIDHKAVQAIVTARTAAGRDRATIRRDLGALRAALYEAKRHGLLDTVLDFGPMTPKAPPGRVRYLDPDEERRFLEALADDATPAYLRPMVLLAMNTGLRRRELFELRWRDVDLDARRLTVPADIAKTDEDRHVQLNATAIAALRDWRLLLLGDALPGPGWRETLVFESRPGKPFTSVKFAWAALCKRAGVDDFRMHDCRHHFASKLVLAGVDLYRVSKLLGHSSVQMTERYAHLQPDALQAAVDTLGGGHGEA